MLSLKIGKMQNVSLAIFGTFTIPSRNVFYFIPLNVLPSFFQQKVVSIKTLFFDQVILLGNFYLIFPCSQFFNLKDYTNELDLYFINDIQVPYCLYFFSKYPESPEYHPKIFLLNLNYAGVGSRVIEG